MPCSYCGTHIWVHPGETIGEYSQEMTLLLQSCGECMRTWPAYFHIRSTGTWIQVHWFRENPVTGRLWFWQCLNCRADTRLRGMPTWKAACERWSVCRPRRATSGPSSPGGDSAETRQLTSKACTISLYTRLCMYNLRKKSCDRLQVGRASSAMSEWGALKCVRCKYGGLKARGANCAVPCWCCFKCECLKCSGTECGGHECGSIKCGCFNARILSATEASMPRVQCVSHVCACPKWSGEVFEFAGNGRAAF